MTSKPDLGKPEHVAAYGVSVEHEATGPRQSRPTLTLLLNARRCPFECVFCDLWMHNHIKATQPGSIPFQIADAIRSKFPPEDFPDGVPAEENWAIKLYNGGNFTDPKSIPDSDWPSIVSLCRPFNRVIIENHASMCGQRLLRFRDTLETKLEVAIGLETANPQVLSRQQKKMTLSDFDRAAQFLQKHQMILRCFTMLQLPFSEAARSVEDSLGSVQHAVHAGAKFVAIIPTRHSTTAMQDLIAKGDHQPPNLRQLEAALWKSLSWIEQVGSDCVVTADTWDIDQVTHCPECQHPTIANIAKMNSSQRAQAPSCCDRCDGQKDLSLEMSR